ncbi:MAG TPA: SusD/RagB family nutrient-binding outer membrane lipoprotein [Ferruginibacter sp.]|nr:SusD/RagB family nutrient-binding outer membrane lipoprotein [Ferruginibacter sp.]HMP21017.1 SusD/RagB family nutrient-binding outer membrane lipoprotein [Ferruginibacter sp.]
MTMKTTHKIFLSLAIVATLLQGCSKFRDFGDINNDPNRTEIPFTAGLLTNILAGIANRATQQNPGYYCQYFSETQYPQISLYSLPQFDFDGIYAGAMFDCQNIINTNTDPDTKTIALVNGSNNNQIAIARIIKAYYFWTITDAWGDIPYTEALKGIENKFPKYDRQEDIYLLLLEELKQANAQFDNGPAIKGDIVYGGNIGQWKKFANSIRMLIALRMSKRYPSAGQLAALEFKAALTDPAGHIAANADNFSVTYPGDSYNNPWFVTYDARRDLGQAEPFVNLLTELNDRRQLNGIYGTSLTGVPYGRNRNYMNNVWGGVFASGIWSRVLGDDYRTSGSRVDIIHASMLLFARAEARELGWTTAAEEPDNAATLYRNAIITSYTQWGLTEADGGAYYNNSDIIYGTNLEENLKKIALQRYIALYPDGHQGWCEWRRTGVPELEPARDALSASGRIPRRFVYGVNDYSTNRKSVLDAVALLPSGDSQDERVWWDR